MAPMIDLILACTYHPLLWTRSSHDEHARLTSSMLCAHPRRSPLLSVSYSAKRLRGCCGRSSFTILSCRTGLLAILACPHPRPSGGPDATKTGATCTAATSCPCPTSGSIHGEPSLSCLILSSLFLHCFRTSSRLTNVPLHQVCGVGPCLPHDPLLARRPPFCQGAAAAPPP
jgi:hypothetical protein